MSNVESRGILTLHGPGHASLERIMSNYRCFKLAPNSRTCRKVFEFGLSFLFEPVTSFSILNRDVASSVAT